jgi:acyl-CoA dehydrogenase
MELTPSARAEDLRQRLHAFLAAEVEPVEARRLATGAGIAADMLRALQTSAHAAGLWNLFLGDEGRGPGLTNLEYAPLAEEMGRIAWGAEVFNCSAPDTGNMEVLLHYGSPEHRARWLEPLLAGEIRSAYAMSEPAAASSDPSQLALAAVRDGGGYRLSGRKWWVTGAGDPRCALFVVMARHPELGERHHQHSMFLVPRDARGVRLVRPLRVFGYENGPGGHWEIELEDVQVPAADLLLGEGRGFEIAQARLGPGRVHHCMRSIGAAERALELLCRRALERHPFGRPLAEQGVWRERIAEARCRIDMARLLVLAAARAMDESGNRAAAKQIAMIKIVAPNVACAVIDWAMQAHGGAGLCDDTPLAELYARERALRIADGPDEVHRETCAKMELRKYEGAGPAQAETGSGAIGL